jgi:predicted molibdopterin-dependent oxidoreductase YjgC
MKDVLTTCVFCGCGCGLYLHEEGGRVTGSSPSRNHPVSRGNLCVKGWNIHEFIHHPARLTEPLLRKDNRLTAVSWDEAIAFTAKRLTEIRDRTAAQGVGVLASAKCTNEEVFLLQKFTRAVLKTNNIDHCARL